MTASALDVIPDYAFDYRDATLRLEKAGYTITKAAALTDKAFGTVRGYVRGDVDPPAAWVCSLAVLLGVKPGQLFCPVAELDDTTVAVEPRPRATRRNLTRKQRLVRRSQTTS
jgi:hypothetical protein